MKGSFIPGAPPSGMGLSSSSLASQPFDDIEDADSGLNLPGLADCFLVLALGFLIALVNVMGVNLADIRELMKDQLAEIDQPEAIIDEIHNTENPYIEMGTVYTDPATGKNYVVTNQDDADDARSDQQNGLDGESDETDQQ